MIPITFLQFHIVYSIISGVSGLHSVVVVVPKEINWNRQPFKDRIVELHSLFCSKIWTQMKFYLSFKQTLKV